MNWFHAETRSGTPILYGPHLLTLRTWVVRVTLPWMPGGLIFNHPYAVTVETGAEPARTLPIINVNRLAQVSIFTLGLLAIVIFRRKQP